MINIRERERLTKLYGLQRIQHTKTDMTANPMSRKPYLSRLRTLDMLFILLLIITAALTRGFFATIPKVMPPGDTFNFINAGKQLPFFAYPSTEKRLPFYPLLIELSPSAVDPVLAATVIAVTASVTVIVLLYLLGRQLKIHPVVLTTVLMLAVVEPRIVSSGIRPLADSVFMVLVLAALLMTIRSLKQVPTSRTIVGIGILFAMLLLTRHEGLAIVSALVAILAYCWRRSWQSIVVMLVTIIIVLTPWFVLTYKMRGTIWYMGYTTEITSSEDPWGASNIYELRDRLRTLVSYTLWDGFVQIPHDANEAVSNGSLSREEYVHTLFGNPIWWLSLLALVGVLWLIITQPVSAVPLLAIGTGTFAIMAFWGPTFRFSAPAMPFWILSVALGATAVLHILQRLFRFHPFVWPAMLLGLVILIGSQIDPFVQETYGRISDNNDRGYAQLTAMRYLAQQSGAVATKKSAGFFQAYVGVVGDPYQPPQRGLVLDKFLGETPVEITKHLDVHQVRYVMSEGDELQELTDYLTSHNRIEKVVHFPTRHPTEDNIVISVIRPSGM
ncbi:MAG: glycosyltransferase family 39 protein [Candidatus Andersenbacteria bacterium]